MPKAKDFINKVSEAEVNDESILKKVEEMINDDKQWLLDKCKKLLHSGGIDSESFGDDFRLPKILYFAALGDLRDNRQPLSAGDKKVAKNLYHF